MTQIYLAVLHMNMCLHVFKLLLISLEISCVSSYTDVEQLVKFGPLEELPDLQYSSYQFEEDLANPGEFLMSCGYALCSYSLETGDFKILAGDIFNDSITSGPALEARFGGTIKLAQLSKTQVVVLDLLAHCLWLFDRTLNQVSQYLGQCGYLRDRYLPKPKELLTKEQWVFMNPASVLFLKEHNSLIVSEYGGYSYEYRIDLGIICILGDSSSLWVLSMPVSTYQLANSDETLLYVFHTYGVSVYDFLTKTSRLLTGVSFNDINGFPNMPTSVKSGPFSDRPVALENPYWLVKDEVIVARVAFDIETLAIMDLRNCVIKYQCITGSHDDLENCQNNRVYSLSVYQNSLLISAAKTGNSGYFDEHLRSSFMRIPMFLKQCGMLEDQLEDQLSVEKITANIGLNDEKKVLCPAGYGINSSYDSVKCIEYYDSENSSYRLEWDRPTPSCSPDCRVFDIKPTKGQKAGGTVVTVTGVICAETTKVILVSAANESMEPNYTVNANNIQFIMPSQNTSYTGVDITIMVSMKLLNGSVNNYSTAYTYLENPQLLLDSQPRETIASGGVEIIFPVANGFSAHRYSLSQSSHTGNCEVITRSTVRCISLPAEDVLNIQDIEFSLYGDGVYIGTHVFKLLPDPQFNTSYNILHVDMEKEITIILRGTGLDLNSLNQYYEVILMDGTTPINCSVSNDSIASTLMSCNIRDDINSLDTNELDIVVKVGYSYREKAGTAKFSKRNTEKSGEEKGKVRTEMIVAIVGTIAVGVLAGAVAFTFWRKRRALQFNVAVNDLYYQVKGEKIFMELNVNLSAELQDMSITPEELKINKNEIIGQGHFGIIYMGQLCREERYTKVAVKTLKEMEATKQQVEQLITEAVFQKGFDHPNVLPSLGVCFYEGILPHVVLPYMAFGDLKSFIMKENVTVTLGDLLHFGNQVACGMEYLAEKRFVHRDLAARNCLLSHEYIVKISDFGMTRDMYQNDYYRPKDGGVPLPIKWMSLESLKTGKFTSETDVWSYGVLLWELFTRGSVPYADVEQFSMRSYLEKGHRLELPDIVPEELANFVRNMWSANPSSRPTFSEIHILLNSILKPLPFNQDTVYPRLATQHIPDDYVTNVTVQNGHIISDEADLHPAAQFFDETTFTVCDNQ